MKQRDELVRRIVEAVHPQRIILFGSAAREDGTWNDIDIMVVMPVGTHRRKTAQKIYDALAGFRDPVDVVVATPADLVQHADSWDLIYSEVLAHGREIYAA